MPNFSYFAALDNDGDANNVVHVGPVPLHWIEVFNGDGATVYLNLYDEVHTEIDPATDAPTLSIGVPAGVARTVPLDISFSLGCVICASSTAAAGGTVPDPAPTVTVFHT